MAQASNGVRPIRAMELLPCNCMPKPQFGHEEQLPSLFHGRLENGANLNDRCDSAD